jgi:hypothetical protein
LYLSRKLLKPEAKENDADEIASGEESNNCEGTKVSRKKGFCQVPNATFYDNHIGNAETERLLRAIKEEVI